MQRLTRRRSVALGAMLATLVAAGSLTACAANVNETCPLSEDDVELYAGVEVADVIVDEDLPPSGVGFGEHVCRYNLTSAPHYVRVEWSSTPGNLLSQVLQSPETTTLYESSDPAVDAVTGTLSWSLPYGFTGQGEYLTQPVLVFDANDYSWRVDVGQSILEPSPGGVDEYASTVALKIGDAIARTGVTPGE
ncbi:hypothetical protein [Microbacterium lacticum]